MKSKNYINTDGNTAVANVAYGFSEVAAIYPITPSSDMGERADGWAAEGRKNIFGERVDVVQMQSEGGAVGAVHGSLSAGAMSTTFTASQGLMLMIPNMFKMAGELLPTVFHVSARSLACQALSIFGDHSDVMATRGTGFAMLCSSDVQEAQDMAVIAHLATLESKIPFLHFFDGFRTSHSIQKIVPISNEEMLSMVDMKFVEEFRALALKPEAPMCKVGAQNPDVYFQGRETVNRFYDACPGIVAKYMELFAKKTGRKYKLFEYIGAPDAENILVAMGSSTETIEETINYLNKNGQKLGLLKVRLFRPFSVEDFLKEIPKTVKKIAVLDRTKEPGSVGEPLYQDVVTVLATSGRQNIKVIGGRYGLSSKEFTPSMIKAVYDHLAKDGWHGFTVGINDDVTKKSIKVTEEIDTEQKGIVRCKFWGYGSDGTVSANKNAIKIIGDSTDLFVQGYFQYDSNKSGGWTISHLRFGKERIQSEYLLNKVDFVALHRASYIGTYDILEGITEGGTFLINSSQKPENIFKLFTKDMQETIRKKKIKVFAIDASKIAKSVGLGGRISSVMQTAFFKVSGVLPEEEAITLIKKFVEKQFARKGPEIVEMNWKAIDAASAAVVQVPAEETEKFAEITKVVPDGSGWFAENIMDPILRLKGDNIPVSAMPINGAIPTGTKRLEYRGVPGNPAIWIDKLPFVKEPNIAEPYIEYPPSCSGCGEVPYIHLVTQLFGDRMIIANATGCTSIYGGTFPLVPYTKDKNGKGPAWANSLFEDNAEFGMGMRLAVDANRRQLKTNVTALIAAGISDGLKAALQKSLTLFDNIDNEAKQHAEEVKKLLAAEKASVGSGNGILNKVIELQDYFVDKSIWIFGGDGWAYDIGFGGLDHVMASSRNVNILVLDTEVYSNTGGQASKATPRGAVAKFASDGKKLSKKNLGLMMSTYGSAYVASVNMGMDREKTALAMVEAEKHNGPSIVIAYSPCIAHGYNMQQAKKQSEKAAKSGYWPMYRFNPDLRDQQQNPWAWDGVNVDTKFDDYIEEEIRYKTLNLTHPDEAKRLVELAVKDNELRFKAIRQLTDNLKD